MPERPRYDHPTVFNYLHDFGCDLRARRVFFHHHMGLSEESHEIGVEFVIRNLLHLDKSPGPIELWLNNPGGDLTEMWGVIDVVQLCKNDVSITGYGYVASAACLLLASGTPGLRYALRNTYLMWHAGTTGITPDMHAADARDRMSWEERCGQRWIQEMAYCTKPRVDGKLLRTQKARIAFWAKHATGGGELWFDARDMLTHGIIDEIWVK